MGRFGKTLVPLAWAAAVVLIRPFPYAWAADIESLARAKAHHKKSGFANPWLAD